MERTRQWFFQSPQGASYSRFSTGNRPPQSTFQDLLDSVCLKTESGDLASATKQGLVILATDAEAEARVVAKSVMAYQLPVLTLGNSTEPTFGGAAISYEGLKLTSVSKTPAGSLTRANFKLEFDPYSLADKAVPVAADSLVLIDSAASNAPKKVTLTALKTLVGGGYWLRDIAGDPYLYPTTSGDNLNLLTGSVYASGLVFNANSTSVYAIVANKSNAAGVDLKLVGGAVTSASVYAGGNVFVYGGLGSSTGAAGVVNLAFNGSSAVGSVGIGCSGVTTYRLKVCGDLYVSGTITHGVNIITAGSGNIVSLVDANGILGTKTMLNFMHEAVGGAPTGKNLLLYNGSAYTVLAVGTTTDKYLVTDGTTCAFGDLVLTNKVDNASVKSNAALAWSKMAALTVSMIPQISSAGVIESSGVASSNLAALSTLATTYKAVVESFVEDTGSVDLTTNYSPYETYSVDVSAGNGTFLLPTMGIGKLAIVKKITIVRKTSDVTKTLTVTPTGSAKIYDESTADVANIVMNAAYHMERIVLIGNGETGSAGAWVMVEHTTGLLT